MPTYSPATGHWSDCPTYDTLDAADCTCPALEESADWERELMAREAAAKARKAARR